MSSICNILHCEGNNLVMAFFRVELVYKYYMQYIYLNLKICFVKIINYLSYMYYKWSRVCLNTTATTTVVWAATSLECGGTPRSPTRLPSVAIMACTPLCKARESHGPKSPVAPYKYPGYSSGQANSVRGAGRISG